MQDCRFYVIWLNKNKCTFLEGSKYTFTFKYRDLSNTFFEAIVVYGDNEPCK